MAPEFVPRRPGPAPDRVAGTACRASDVPGRRLDCDTVWGDAGTSQSFLWRSREHFHLFSVFYPATRELFVRFKRRMAGVAGGVAAQFVLRDFGTFPDEPDPV